jgi:hypothetical protein
MEMVFPAKCQPSPMESGIYESRFDVCGNQPLANRFGVDFLFLNKKMVDC